MERESGSRKGPVVFPCLIEEPKPSHQDAINRSFFTGVMSKWSSKQSQVIKDAFPPSKNVLSSHSRERTLKKFHSTSQTNVTAKNYSCPNIVDMSNVIFYHDRGTQRGPRRIINGFFPNKIRSAQRGGDGIGENKTRAPQFQVGNGIYFRTKDSTNLTGLRGDHKHRTSFLHGPKSTSYYPEEHVDVRRSQSCWPVRNGSPSPWLQRYKVKKRATTSLALKNPAQPCCEKGSDNRSKRNQQYVNLSSAVILDAF